jgi:exo-beta-1,3-glucanase (GH17 family)
MTKIFPTSTFLYPAFIGLFSAIGFIGLVPGDVRAARLDAQASAARDTNIVLKDPRPFKCICYSGYRDGQAPGQSEPNETQVREDLVLVKKYTHEIRTYGCGKGTHGYIIPRLADEIGLKVDLGIWVDDKYTEDANLAAVNEAIALVNEGHKSIRSVIVGNEFMFRVRNIDKRPVAPAEARLVNWVKLVRAGIPKSVLVTTADTWSDVNSNSDALLSQLDFVTWHTHPWWENQPIANAATYVASRLKIMQDRVAKVGGKPLVLGETGWPTFANNGPAVGSPENQSKFFKDLTAWGFNNNAEFWSFTAFDEKWKDAEGTVGGHWGFWDSGRQPYYIISNIATLMPRYMQTENPDQPTGLTGPARVLGAPRAEFTRNLHDALGRNAGLFTSSASASNPVLEAAARQGRILVPSKSSRGALILAP